MPFDEPVQHEPERPSGSKLTPWGRLIRGWRIERGMLLMDMADALGMTAPQLSDYEMGRKEITPEVSQAVCDFMFPASGP